ncbi:mechanosensitive ion channel protein [Microbulbifer flavimaris]|uniref:Mechanosensitive ion channel protein n=1 Tax=Microbulbifer flavimaris TaxID=1781068 RepID=A0ABX4I3M4_9GAMM|nr:MULTISPECIES: mechanosensitive ion channel domain-containing protein [Microbulbifer]KUJ84419.1 mechanosensitive ion channel protein [Microbulbifer sp. ZGT114]PCO06505.1 mechanosensitive ion channel protein [Microbulbifer flavimaris]
METEELLEELKQNVGQALTSTDEMEVLGQLGIISVIYLLAYVIAHRLVKLVPWFKRPPAHPRQSPIHLLVYRCGRLLFPLLAIVLLRLDLAFVPQFRGETWVVQAAFAIAIILLFNDFVKLVITRPAVATVFRWVGMPILFLYVIGALDDIVRVLDSMAIELGNIRISAYGIARALIFGSLLFWLGRVSNSTGQTIIRNQEALDYRTREVAAKLFEITLFTLVFILILNLMGINLTALAVFGGAVGVGIGFGLQNIASNFISGLIIIMDRSVTLGDYIGLEDGRCGTVSKLSFRAVTLETFDGKDVVVPNEKFVSEPFVNWTQKNRKQRYRVDFSVAYSTNMREVVEIIKAAVSEHPQVLSGEDLPIEERPDCEIDSFGDNGVNMFVEFWMVGVDDGRNRVGGDLLLIILETLQQNGVEIPFPQRDVRIVDGATAETL